MAFQLSGCHDNEGKRQCGRWTGVRWNHGEVTCPAEPDADWVGGGGWRLQVAAVCKASVIKVIVEAETRYLKVNNNTN